MGGMALTAPFGGVIAGAVGGAALGLLACKVLQDPIKKKIFSAAARLTDHEILMALRALRVQQPNISKEDALNLLARIRLEATKNPAKYSVA